MRADPPVQVPPAWEQLPLSGLKGVLLVIGAPDAGKSTFARYLYRRLGADSGQVALLDGDPGQSRLGPPATLTVAVGRPGQADAAWRRFIGAVSPRGHMLSLLVAGARLVEAARAAGAETIIYDTTGLIGLAGGGNALKLAKINLLQPRAVLAIRRGQELESLLAPLRRSRRVPVIDVPSAPARRTRDTPARQAHRAAQFARYFAGARSLRVELPGLAVFPARRFTRFQLVALEDREGFCRGLGIVQRYDLNHGQVSLYSPLASLEGVDALNLGDLTVDPDTFRDQPLVPGSRPDEE